MYHKRGLKTSHFTLPYSHFSTPIQQLLQSNKASLALWKQNYQHAKEALFIVVGVNNAAKLHKICSINFQNQFLFCNTFLPLVRYLHIGQEDMFFWHEDKKTFFLFFSHPNIMSSCLPVKKSLSSCLKSLPVKKRFSAYQNAYLDYYL